MHGNQSTNTEPHAHSSMEISILQLSMVPRATCALVSTISQFPQCPTCLIRLRVPLPALHISHVIATCLIVLTILTHSTSPPQVTWKLHTKFTAVPLSHSYFTCSHSLDVLMSTIASFLCLACLICLRYLCTAIHISLASHTYDLIVNFATHILCKVTCQYDLKSLLMSCDQSMAFIANATHILCKVTCQYDLKSQIHHPRRPSFLYHVTNPWPNTLGLCPRHCHSDIG